MKVTVEEPKALPAFPPLVGLFNVKVSAVDPVSIVDGYERTNVNYEVLAGQGADGRTIQYDMFSTAPNMVWKISALAHALGYATGQEIDFDDFMLHLVGKVFKAKVKMGAEYNGNSYPKVAQYLVYEGDTTNTVLNDQNSLDITAKAETSINEMF